MKKLTVVSCVLCCVALMGVLTSCGGADKTSAFRENGKISVVSREDGSGTRGAFIELMGIQEKGADGKTTDKTTKEAIIANNTDVMLTNIAGNAYAVGYTSLGSLNDTVRALKIDGVEATAENVKSGTYKAVRPFNIAASSPTPLAQDFIDYILSAEGQQIIADSYISVKDNAPAYAGKEMNGKIVIAGSSSITPIMEKLKEGYIVHNPQVNIEIQMSDSTSGMTAAANGTCDIGMASRELKDSEKQKLQPIQIALDGIAVITNRENPMENITSENVRAIFTGEKTVWSEIQ